MALLLNIDTAVKAPSVCLSNDTKVLGELSNPSERESAAWLHVAIQDLLKQNSFQLEQLNAIAICSGPGSYTGLRVGMAAAKGLCYALNIPLITINTLQVMAASAITCATELLCPMIDARRMEVFTAVFDRQLQEVMPSTNLILEQDSLAVWLEEHTITLFGNGSEKARPVIIHPNAFFASVTTSAADMAALSTNKFVSRQFADLAYEEPFYGKDFHSSFPKKNY